MNPEPDTRARILEAAERLFAEGGEEATSIRAITREAGVNVAAVHYHFGGRDEVLRLVLDRWIAPINARRMQLLAAAAAEHGVVPVRALMEAFLRPDLEVLARLRHDSPHIARFIGRAYGQPSPAVAAFMNVQFAPVAARLIPLLQAALPDLPAEELSKRLWFVVGIVTSLFAKAEQASEVAPAAIEAELAQLLDFAVAGLCAGMSAS